MSKKEDYTDYSIGSNDHGKEVDNDAINDLMNALEESNN